MIDMEGLIIHNNISDIIRLIYNIKYSLTEKNPPETLQDTMWRVSFLNKLSSISNDLSLLQKTRELEYWKNRDLKRIRKIKELVSSLNTSIKSLPSDCKSDA